MFPKTTSPHHLGGFETSTLRCFQACPIGLFASRSCFNQTITQICTHCTENHVAFVRLYNNRERLTFLQCARTTRSTGLCTATQAARSLGLALRTDGITAYSVLYLKVKMLCAARLVRMVWPGITRKGTEQVNLVSFLGDHPSFVSLGLRVTSAPLGFARRARPPTKNYTHKKQK